MVVLLFILSLAIGVLVGIGASSFSRYDSASTNQGQHHAPPLSRIAAELGYAAERDFENDNVRANNATVQVLLAAPGTQRLWENAETGNRGVIWSGGESQGPDGSICRDLVRRTLINNAYRNASATACHRQGQSWDANPEWRNQ